MLAYAGLNWEDRIYTSREEWLNYDKLHLGSNYPNLPYLKESGNVVVETLAIASYIIDRFGLVYSFII